MNNNKQLSNPTSTGGLGVHFENRIQASFVVMMLTGGFSPCLPTWPINKIKLQGKYQNFDTDDLIVYVSTIDNNSEAKLLGQIKHSISLTRKSKVFGEVISAAWSDFQKENFNEGLDAIALITGPLSLADTNDVRNLLRQAKHSESAEDFMNKVTLANFTSEKQREKLEVFKTHLLAANNNDPLTNDQLWRFLKSFNILIYDLDIRGVMFTLLHTLIAQYSQDRVKELLALIEQEVSYESENAGCITIDNLAPNIRKAFEKPVIKNIPSKFIPSSTSYLEVEPDSYIRTTFISEPNMVWANLFGSWDEKSKSDRELIERFTGKDYEIWISKIREVSLQPSSPISIKNGIWSINERVKVWRYLGSRIFDVNLDTFKECAIAVLLEKNTKFELPPEERFSASIYGKGLKYSESLRKGISESLALLGNYPEGLRNCSLNKPELIVTSILRAVFKGADWILWGSLNNLLPNIAEANPSEFLEIVESVITEPSHPFKELFSQEEGGALGENYLTGFLWALEGLAWEEQYLVRVSVLLGELAAQDPGGNWSNRPLNSLKTIFLPWLPQTIAPLEKRKVALQIICNEVPEIGWELLLSLLPHRNQTSIGSYKPLWRKVASKEIANEVTKDEYITQTIIYADIVIKLAIGDSNKLRKLIEYFNVLPKSSVMEIIDHIISDGILMKPEEERVIIWSELVKFMSKNKESFENNSEIDSEVVSRIETATQKLVPTNPLNLYQEIFNYHAIDLLEGNQDWEAQELKIKKRRQQAIKEILNYGGVESICKFAKKVKEASEVGYALANLGEFHMECKIIPELLNSTDEKLLLLASGYISQKYYIQGWKWVDSINMQFWTPQQIGMFFTYLPFTAETWKRVNLLLPNMESCYWEKTSIAPYQATGNINVAVEKLIENKRASAAIYCMSVIVQKNQPLNRELAFQAFLLALSSNKQISTMDRYHFIKVIKNLQNDSLTDKNALLELEWLYLPLLDKEGGEPKTLENELASNPEFFSQIIRLIYRSELQVDSKGEFTEQQKSIATNAYALLDNWKVVPGTQQNGVFSEEYFLKWFKEAKQQCQSSGHLKVALQHIGAVLFYSPSDSSGLWINRTVAKVLNEKHLKSMRKGFYTKAFNSRGAFWVDPTGKQEFDLAKKYRNQADDIENAGYQRFATTIKSLAEYYEDRKSVV